MLGVGVGINLREEDAKSAEEGEGHRGSRSGAGKRKIGRGKVMRKPRARFRVRDLEQELSHPVS